MISAFCSRGTNAEPCLGTFSCVGLLRNMVSAILAVAEMDNHLCVAANVVNVVNVVLDGDDGRVVV